jgi:hypothetical protein
MIRVAAGVIAAGLALAGCGSTDDHRRDAVNGYIKQVNDAQREALLPWQRAQAGYVAVGSGKVTESELRDLARAPKTIRDLRARIASVEAPDDARRLRTRLLRLLDLDAQFASEVQTFSRYVRDVTPLEQQVAARTVQLRRTLQRSPASELEQQALHRYAVQLDGLAARLERLAPPRALAPWHAQQVARLTTLRRGARDLTRGLATRDVAITRQGLEALAQAASTSPVTVADRTAVVAYNKRLRRIDAAAAAVAAEQRRLTQELR